MSTNTPEILETPSLPDSLVFTPQEHCTQFFVLRKKCCIEEPDECQPTPKCNVKKTNTCETPEDLHCGHNNPPACNPPPKCKVKKSNICDADEDLPCGHKSGCNKTPKCGLDSKDNTLKLIALYKCFETLWNPNAYGYNNAHLKESLWNLIAHKMGNKYTAEQVRNKIEQLRKSYFAQRHSDGRSSLFYSNEMKFLDCVAHVETECNKPHDETECKKPQQNSCPKNKIKWSDSHDSLTKCPSNTECNSFKPQQEANTCCDQNDIYIKGRSSVMDEQCYGSRAPEPMNCSASKSPETCPPPPCQPEPSPQDPCICGEVQSFCEMLAWELLHLSPERFYQAKWLILDVLKKAQGKC